MAEIRCKKGARLTSAAATFDQSPIGTEMMPAVFNPQPHINIRNSNYSVGKTQLPGFNLGLELARQRQLLEERINNIDYLAERILLALGQQAGLSLIRLGDAEILALAQDLVFPTNVPIENWGNLMADLCCDAFLGNGDNEVLHWNYYLQCSGVHYPDIAIRDLLIQAVRLATFVGVPSAYRPGRSLEHVKLLHGFQTVLLKSFEKTGISLDGMNFVDSAAHYLLYASGWLNRLLFLDQYPDLCSRYSISAGFKPRILLAGHQSPGLNDLLTSAGCIVVAAIHPVYIYNIEEVIAEIQAHSFDIALISAGIPAKYICSYIASNMNKIALDLGHLSDMLCINQSLDFSRFEVPYTWVL